MMPRQVDPLLAAGIDSIDMPESLTDPVIESLVNDFGGNYAFALDLLEDYRRDRQSVDRSWRATSSRMRRSLA